MAKKSLKSKIIVRQPKHKINAMSFDRFTFKLGDIRVLMHYLNKQTQKILIKLYRKKLLNVLIKNVNKIESQKERIVILTQNQAVEIIKHVTLLKQRTLLEKESQKNLQFLRMIEYQSQQSPLDTEQKHTSKLDTKITQEKYDRSTRAAQNTNIHYKNYLQSFKETFTKVHNQFQYANKSLQNNQNQMNAKLRPLMRTKILSIEMELFIETIVMIIDLLDGQKKSQQNQLDKIDQSNKSEILSQQNCIRCVVVFEQSYPPKLFMKKQLIQMIGRQQYQTKRVHTLKIYHVSTIHQHFNNPDFITCHDCMRVITNVGFPQHDLKCLKTFNQGKSKNIDSPFLITPQKFLDKFINHEFFNTYEGDRMFEHPFVQYHIKTENDEKLSCERNWCGPCQIKNQRRVNINECDFCEFDCHCSRCKKYERFVQLLGHYLKIGGSINQIEEKFIFNRVFSQSSQYFSNNFLNKNDETRKIKSSNFKQYLKIMYENQKEKNENFLTSIPWLTLQSSFLLSGVFAEQDKKDFEQIFFHQDKLRKKQKIDFRKRFQIEKKNYQKYAYEKKQKNVDLAISRLEQSIKVKIIQSQFSQVQMLKRKLQRSKILKSSNPLTNNRLKFNNADIVIFSQSGLKKSERKFHKLTEIKEINPINKARQERQYVKVRRDDYLREKTEKHLLESKKDYWKEYSLNKDIIQESNKSEKDSRNDQSEQNYGSIWE